MAGTTGSGRRRGRPRVKPRKGDVDPRNEIIAAAAGLFGERGVASATMSEIARRAGLQQSSIYYYFADKEAILAEILAGVNRIPLQRFREIEDEGGSPGITLHRIVRADVLILCGFPFDLNQVHRLEAVRDERFAEYWEERRELHRRVQGVIERGIEIGEFVQVDPSLAALTILAGDEASQNWMRTYDASSSPRPDAADPEQVADFIADFVLRSLLVEATALESIHSSSGPPAD